MPHMKAWTKQAEQRLAEYLDARARREGFSGAEAEDLKMDLRCHILEEAGQDPSETVNVAVLEQLLGRLDAGYHPPTSPPEEREIRYRGFKAFCIWIFGVILPFGVVIFEWISNFCGGVFFDPVPTLWHVALLLIVPLANLWILKGGSDFHAGLAGGIGLVVSLFYLLLFVPLLPLSAIAVVFMGMGFLSLTPIFAGLTTWRLTRRMARLSPVFGRGRRWGIAAGILALLLLEGPPLWTRVNLEMATGEKASPAALARLRAFHSERVLLKACYEGNRRTSMAADISSWLIMGWKIAPSFFGLSDGPFLTDNRAEQMREVYFRITGKPIDAVEPPPSARKALARGGSDDWNEFEFDPNVGGNQVALRLKGLSMADSRFDGHFDSASQLGYGEWTMVFSNRSSQQKEARCQVRLPQGGRVSRLTLWVNGEPREAAFSSVSKVKEAYRKIAVVQRRDPVLVTMCGPDTVMVQCFPIPANGEMKIRLGVTAPLTDGRWALPCIVERNFGWKDGLKQAVWLQGDKPFELKNPSQPARDSNPDGPGQSLSVDLAPDKDNACQLVEMAGLENPPAPVWCTDPFAKDEGKFLLREAKGRTDARGAAPVIVIDGSAPMAVTTSWLPDLLEKTAGSSTILLADDTARKISPGDLRHHAFNGGRDNEPALREAVRLAKEHPGTGIVWLHGPQAVKLAQPEALLQLLERGTTHPTIHSIDAAPGPNRLGEALYPSGAMVQGPMLLEPAKDLTAFLTSLRTQGGIRWEWTHSPTSTGLPGREVWDHLARDWAARQTDSGAAPELAARYQLVTQNSGAVVLETNAQYVEAGLEPGNPQASPQIPSIPEPSALLLVMIAGTCAALRRQRAKA